MSKFYEIKGCIHIHVPFEFMYNGFDMLARAGRISKVDFLVINSHTPSAKKSKNSHKLFGYEKYYGKTLIMKGEEADDKKKHNHLLIIGGTKWHGNKEDTQQLLEAIKQESCKSFIAHPEGFHKLFLVKKDYSWYDSSIKDVTGMEVWSLLFDWAKYTKVYNIPARYFALPQNLEGPGRKTLRMWDNNAMKRPMTGIAGLDIHMLPLLFRLLDIRKIFNYEKIFRTLRNHLLLREELTGDAKKDKKTIMDTLKKGSLFFANDYISDSSGFFFGTSDGKATMGDSVKSGTKIFVKAPKKAAIRLIWNGTLIKGEETCSFDFTLREKGVYRIEVFLNGKPWIFSNHIRVDSL